MICAQTRLAEEIGRHVLTGQAIFADDTPVNAGQRQDPHRPPVGLCPRRAPLERGCSASRSLLLLPRPQGRAPKGPPLRLHGLDACRRLRRVRGPLNKDLVETAPDITVEELRAALAKRGRCFGDGTIQRFFRRHGITRKKDRARQRLEGEEPPRRRSTARASRLVGNVLRQQVAGVGVRWSPKSGHAAKLGSSMSGSPSASSPTSYR